MEIKYLNNEKYINAIKELDEISDMYSQFYLGQMYGIFDKKILVGYCTFGGADYEELEREPNWSYQSLVLGNVYIRKEYRGLGYGKSLIEYALSDYELITDNASVYVYILHDELILFYNKFGFIKCDNTDNLMVLKSRDKRGD